MKEKNIVGNNIRKMRINAGFTQEELALRSGLSQGYINQLESGKRRFTQKTMELIAEALSIPLSELFKEGEIPKTPVITERTESYKRRRPNKKDFLGLLKELPDHIVEHYLILLRLEKEVWASASSKKTSS